jgi:hypothetical protein
VYAITKREPFLSAPREAEIIELAYLILIFLGSRINAVNP